METILSNARANGRRRQEGGRLLKAEKFGASRPRTETSSQENPGSRRVTAWVIYGSLDNGAHPAHHPRKIQDQLPSQISHPIIGFSPQKPMSQAIEQEKEPMQAWPEKDWTRIKKVASARRRSHILGRFWLLLSRKFGNDLARIEKRPMFQRVAKE